MVSTWGVKLCLIYIYCASFVHTLDIPVAIPLNGTITYDNRETYHEFRTLNDSTTLVINFENINKNFTFVVLQVHSHIHNVTLFKNENIRTQRVIGTNVGLVSQSLATDKFYLSNTNVNTSQRVYISVHGYFQDDPIPGGCNMEWDVKISPFLRTITNQDYITVDAPAYDGDNSNCNIATMGNMTFYIMYLPEMNFYADVYFDSIRKMMTLKGIEGNGRIIHGTNYRMLNRRMLSTYPGTGAIYAVIATDLYNKSVYSVYVPSHSYGCFVSDEDGCEIIDDELSQVLCAFLFFSGVFVCFLGHRFFKTEMFLSGFFAGVIISYIVLAMITSMERPVLLSASTISGLFFGATWLLFWWLYGIPVISVLLPTLQLGFLLSAIFYFRLPSIATQIMYLEDDFNFWSVFCLVMCLTALALVSMTFAANILCCAILGGFASVHALDYYLGSSLKFIIINTIRRAVVADFNKAVIMAPFQWRDIMVGLTWFILSSLGFMVQHWYNRGRPPFPPPPRNTRPTMAEPYRYGRVVDLAREYIPAPQPRPMVYGTIAPAGTLASGTIPSGTLPMDATARTPLLA